MEEVEGSADLAYLRGRGELAFTYTQPGGEAAEYTSEAVGGDGGPASGSADNFEERACTNNDPNQASATFPQRTPWGLPF